MYKLTKNQRAMIEWAMKHADYDPGKLVFGYEKFTKSTNIYCCIIGSIHACVVSRCTTLISIALIQERIDAFVTYSFIVTPLPLATAPVGQKD